MDWMNAPNPYSGLGGKSSDIPDFASLGDVPESSGASITLGVGTDGPVCVDLDAESPHILVNAPTGLGKSAVARSAAVQRLSLGDLVVVLDVKMHSHRWARPLAPVVHYSDTDAEVGASLVNLGRELHRRNQVVRDFTGDVKDAPVGPRIVVIFEETNATLSHLATLDRQMAQGGYKALDAFRDLMFMGRAVKMHVIGFAQLASYRSGLTADLIENFGTKVLIGASQKAWKWLVPECGQHRSAPEVDGRGFVCHGNRASEAQLLWVEESDAAERVLSSLPAQRRARELAGNRRRLPEAWQQAIGR
jgi:hypothetical protein